MWLKVNSAFSYQQWRIYASWLDDLKKIGNWKENSSSKHYDSVRIKEVFTYLQSCLERKSEEELVFLLQSHCYRHIYNITNAKLYQYSFVGTKKLVEEFQAGIIKALRFLSSEE